MFALPAVHLSTKQRAAGHLWLGEVVATAGLILLIFALARSGRVPVAPAAVGVYIGASRHFDHVIIGRPSSARSRCAGPAYADPRGSRRTHRPVP
jgi:glycerol uptake facilitator-like aquaporin